jgi:hypothetical protein
MQRVPMRGSFVARALRQPLPTRVQLQSALCSTSAAAPPTLPLARGHTAAVLRVALGAASHGLSPRRRALYSGAAGGVPSLQKQLMSTFSRASQLLRAELEANRSPSDGAAQGTFARLLNDARQAEEVRREAARRVHLFIGVSHEMSVATGTRGCAARAAAETLRCVFAPWFLGVGSRCCAAPAGPSAASPTSFYI